MNPYEIIDKYYPDNTEQRQILVIHSLSVAGKAMKILDAHPELRLNRSFVKEAALLHDIGIFQTDAPTIQCFGSHPYIAHGYLGAEILREEGFPQHALVCERHTGAGLSLQDIVDQQRMQLLAEQSCPLCQHHQRQLYEHGCGLLVLLHRRGAVYLLDCYLQLKLLLVFIHKL